jgi:biopolymer transport protein ExbD
MGRRVPWKALIGIGLILAGWAANAGVERWMNTWIVRPVDMPVSLAAGHIHTGPFRANLRADYWVVVHTNYEWVTDHHKCNPYPKLQIKWVLYREGKVVHRLDQPSPINWPSGFSASPGIYDLDVEVPADFSCLDPGHPRLRVIAITANYDIGVSVVKGLALVCAVLGGVMLTFLPLVQRVRRVQEETLTVTGSTVVGQYFRWARKRPLRRRISGLPAFGLFGGMVFALLALLMMLLTAGFEYIPMGFWVHVLKSGQAPAKSDAWTEPLIVRVKDTGPYQIPKLFVNSNEVAWQDLEKTLKQELGPRRDWVVYVGGDDATSFQHVANVIDVARGLHAKAVLITEKE